MEEDPFKKRDLHFKTLTPISRSYTWNGRSSSSSNNSSSLCDSYEIKAINLSLEQVLHLPPPPKESSSVVENEKPLSVSPTKTRTAIWRLSPWNGGSTLYDSYELKAVTQQLNRALQTTQARSSSPYLGYLASPLYACHRRCLDHLYKESAKTPKRVTSGRLVGNGRAGNKDRRGFVPRLWKKLKRTFLWRKQG